MFQENKKISIKEIVSNVPLDKKNCGLCDIQIKRSLNFMFKEIYNQLLEYDEIELDDVSEHFSSIVRIPRLSDLENTPSKDNLAYTKNNNVNEFKVVFVRKKMENEINE